MTAQIPKLSSYKDVYRIEKDLSLLHSIEDFFVKTKNDKVNDNDLIVYLSIHKTPYLKVAQSILEDSQRLGYIIVEHSKVKASPLLHETIVSYEKAIKNYHKRDCSGSISYYEIDKKFDKITALLNKILKLGEKNNNAVKSTNEI